MVSQDQVLDGVLTVLNNTNYMEDPLGTERSGSFAFSPTQHITYTRQMPKMQVIYSDSALEGDRSFGGDFRRNKGVALTVFIYVPTNVNHNGLHADSLIRKIEDDIEQAIVKGRHEIPMNFDDFGDIVEPGFSKDQHVKIGAKPIVFSKRKKYG